MTSKNTTLFIRKQNGRYIEAPRELVCETAATYVQPLDGQVIRSPQDTAEYLHSQMDHLTHEVFAAVFLDNRHKVIKYQELFRGTIDGTSVYPREVAKETILCNAAAVILAHNHPSGIAEPSQADERITKRLKSALELIDVRLLDHLVVGKNQDVSLASRGLL